MFVPVDCHFPRQIKPRSSFFIAKGQPAWQDEPWLVRRLQSRLVLPDQYHPMAIAARHRRLVPLSRNHRFVGPPSQTVVLLASIGRCVVSLRAISKTGPSIRARGVGSSGLLAPWRAGFGVVAWH